MPASAPAPSSCRHEYSSDQPSGEWRKRYSSPITPQRWGHQTTQHVIEPAIYQRIQSIYVAAKRDELFERCVQSCSVVFRSFGEPGPEREFWTTFAMTLLRTRRSMTFRESWLSSLNVSAAGFRYSQRSLWPLIESSVPCIFLFQAPAEKPRPRPASNAFLLTIQDVEEHSLCQNRLQNCLTILDEIVDLFFAALKKQKTLSSNLTKTHQRLENDVVYVL